MLSFAKPIFDLLQSDLTTLIAFASVLGLVIGSFLNVVIYRLPKILEATWKENCSEVNPLKSKFNLATPPSRCPHCQHHISVTENIPLLSYFWLKGKCRHCKTCISLRYPLIELLSGLSTGLSVWYFGYSLTAVAAAVFILALMTLTMIDLDSGLLPDIITLPLLWLGLLFNINDGFIDLSSAVIGAALGYLILWFVYWLFKLVTKKDGMGHGDFKMFAAIGAWFGWEALPASIFLSALAGTLTGVAMMTFSQQHRHSQMPFGPFIAGSGILLLFFRPQILGIYLG